MSTHSEAIAVFGAGVMGAGIAQVLALSGHEVRCIDISDSALEAGRATVDTGKYGLASAVKRGLITQDQAGAALARITFTTDSSAAADTDLVIEAIPERLDLKIRLFRELDKICRPDTILASNSSGFPISALAAATDRPELVIGWHWASPAPVMKFAEIVRGPETSDATVDTVVRLAREAGKDPVVVNDAPLAWGYVANRIYAAMIAEAQRVVREGVTDREGVDRLMVNCFRWPVGPFGMTSGATTGWK